MHFLFVSSINAYKCHIINFLLTSLARYVQRNIGPRSFCTNLALRARSVQKSPRSDIALYMQTSRSVNKKKVILKINTRSRCDVVYRELDGLLIKSGFIMGLMQVSVQFPAISVTILEVLYVVYIIITSVHQKF
jgi:hypothetical protein